MSLRGSVDPIDAVTLRPSGAAKVRTHPGVSDRAVNRRLRARAETAVVPSGVLVLAATWTWCSIQWQRRALIALPAVTMGR
jgi:hypothetical protein